MPAKLDGGGEIQSNLKGEEIWSGGENSDLHSVFFNLKTSQIQVGFAWIFSRAMHAVHHLSIVI